MTGAVWIPPIAAVASWALAGVVHGYARRRLLDVPNARSSHAIPTPRGGGLAIVVTFVAGVFAAWALGAIPPRLAVGLALPGVAVAAIGFLDDHGHVPARWRIAVHLAAAVVGLLLLGGVPPVVVAGRVVSLGLAGDVLGVLALVWMLNLYNFMDGIDGLAGAEAVTVGLAGAALGAYVGPADTSWLVPAILAGAAAGFLVWNAPPARIFMGDVGSGFLGLILGLLALRAGHARSTLLWAWAILLGVFAIDATVTLLRRLVAGERVYEAHRTHAYQQAARRHGGHGPVTTAAVLITLGWLAPIATLVATDRLGPVVGVLLAYTPLVVLALRYDAGVRLPASPPDGAGDGRGD